MNNKRNLWSHLRHLCLLNIFSFILCDLYVICATLPVEAFIHSLIRRILLQPSITSLVLTLSCCSRFFGVHNDYCHRCYFCCCLFVSHSPYLKKEASTSEKAFKCLICYVSAYGWGARDKTTLHGASCYYCWTQEHRASECHGLENALH